MGMPLAPLSGPYSYFLKNIYLKTPYRFENIVKEPIKHSRILIIPY